MNDEPREANRSEAEIAEGKQTTEGSPKGERSESMTNDEWAPLLRAVFCGVSEVTGLRKAVAAQPQSIWGRLRTMEGRVTLRGR